MSQQGKISYNDIIGTLTLKGSVGQSYFQATSKQKMSQQGNISCKDIIGTLTI